MPELTANNLTLHYDERGHRDDPAMLMIMGVGAQMTLWREELLDALAGHGFRVIRFDNRDIGLSQKMEHEKVPSILWLMICDKLGLTPQVPYQLSDMANDAAGVLDALEIEKAHVVGASMGGMIAQNMAAQHPERLLSLTSIMSSSGNRKLPQADKDVIRIMIKRPRSGDIASQIEFGKAFGRAVSGPGYPVDEDSLHKRATDSITRSYYPQGFIRQSAAIVADGDRRERLRTITAPTLVLHGEADPLVPVEHGRDTAAHIPGANLHTIPGWGHDLPLELVDTFAAMIAEHAHGAIKQSAAA